MKKNIYHFIAICSLVIFLTWEIFLLGAFLKDTKRVDIAFNHYVWIIPIVLYAFVIVTGVLQIIKEKTEGRKYVGYLTIFFGYALFPIVVSLVMFERSGLSKSEREIGIKKWYIDHYVELKNELKERKLLSPELWKRLERVKELQNEGMLDTYNGNAYKYSLIIKEIPQDKLPKIYDESEIISTEKDIPMTKVKK